MSDILALAGSTRDGSLNLKLLRMLADRAEDTGASVTMIDLRGFPMPLFDADLEEREGLPATARELKQIVAEHRGLLITSPEYNSSLSPLLKNTVDWLSRSETPEEPALAVFQNKVASIAAASPGNLGGQRGLVVLRMLLQNIGVTVLPAQIAVPGAHEAFGDDGGLLVEALDQQATRVAQELGDMMQRKKS